MRPDRDDILFIGPSFTDYAFIDNDPLLSGSCSPGNGYKDSETICPSLLAGLTTEYFGPNIDPTHLLDVPEISFSTSSSVSKGSPSSEQASTPLSMSNEGAASASVVPQQSRSPKNKTPAPSTCKTCGQVFTHRKSLWNHEQAEHKGKRYDCDVEGCTYRATRAANLRRHKRIVHNR